MELKKWFDKYKPFYNDFGQENTFEDIFGGIYLDGNIRFKTGVMDKNFYSEESMKEIHKLSKNENEQSELNVLK